MRVYLAYFYVLDTQFLSFTIFLPYRTEDKKERFFLLFRAHARGRVLGRDLKENFDKKKFL